MCFVFTYKIPTHKRKSANIELRGDDLDIIEDILEYIPDDREDILLYLSHLQSEIEENLIEGE